MNKTWTRDDTKEWILQLENRLEDIDYYLQRTVEWCGNYGIWNDEHVFILSFMTVIWVSNMRLEPVSKKEIFEIVGISGWEEMIDQEYSLGAEYHNLDFEEMLNLVASKF